jgi:hypothetical protein
MQVASQGGLFVGLSAGVGSRRLVEALAGGALPETAAAAVLLVSRGSRARRSSCCQNTWVAGRVMS